MKRKPSCATAKLTLFAISKDEWNKKEGTGKSMKNALYVGMPKGTSWVEATSNSEQFKPVALAMFYLTNTAPSSFRKIAAGF